MCMIKPVLSTRVPDSGGVPLATIQDFPGMGLGIDPGTRIIIRALAMLLVDRFLTLADQASILHLQRMHCHNFLSERTR
jgi:hypothetical protein